MSFRKGRARRFLATLLSLILVFVNESALSKEGLGRIYI